MTLKEVGVDAIPQAEKDVLNMAAAKGIITDGRSFGLFESEAFQEFFRKLRRGWDPITRYQVDSRLDDVHKMFQREVMSLFRAAEHLNIIFDASDNVSSHRIVNIAVKLPSVTGPLSQKYRNKQERETALFCYRKPFASSAPALSGRNLRSR